MVDYKLISTREEALKAWNRKSVIVREDDGYYFVYPLISKGYKYPSFNLRRECCLNTFISEDGAMKWARDSDYEPVILR